ncbi:hypothetical protein [Pseudomonas sp. UFMG81]|uniref:hypothetical protein n=1 Tax=Pseudomonas sp. UFMG81 TaxID=2745936 RepID=UPI00188EE8D4|nr:hypothetical protein [Pseudomonas sp. UFMG81]
MILENFTAELHCRHGQVGVADTSFTDNIITSADEDGWLCTRNARTNQEGFKAVSFNFKFHKKNSDRILYAISCADEWDYIDARLERNKNGWLGLYGTHIAGRYIDAISTLIHGSQEYIWRIEPLQKWDGNVNSAETIEFYIRDHHGHRVSQTRALVNGRGNGSYLNASEQEGEILTFTLRNIVLESNGEWEFEL